MYSNLKIYQEKTTLRSMCKKTDFLYAMIGKLKKDGPKLFKY